MKSSSLRLSIVTIFISFFGLMSAASATVICQLPVCNIANKIAELRASSREARANFYAELTGKYKASRDQAILANLIDFSVEANKLSIELDSDEEYVTDLAMNLLNRSLDYAILQPPLVGSTYGYWYSQFVGVSASSHRYQALLYWDAQLKHNVLTTADEFRQLIIFMKLAGNASENLKDEDFVANFARNIGTSAGLHLLRLAPYMEGVYNIQISCKAIDAAVCPRMNKFSMVLGDQWRGVEGAFINTELENPVFEFNEIKIIDETTIYGETGPMDVPIAPGSMHLVFDKSKNTFTGQIRTPRTQIEVQVTGQRIVSPDELYQITKPSTLIAIDAVEGYYTGNISTQAANWADQILPGYVDFNLVITRYAENSFKATMRADNSLNIIFDFPAAYYFENLGVITTYTADRHGLLKITYVYRNSNGVPKWLGFAQSLRTGQYFYLELGAK